jgi:hypothetical protein
MFYRQTFRDSFQRHYVIIHSQENDSQSYKKPVEFLELENNRSFVGNLYIEEDYWRNRPGPLEIFKGSSHNEAKINISEILLNQQLTVFPVTEFPISETGKAVRTFPRVDLAS